MYHFSTFCTTFANGFRRKSGFQITLWAKMAFAISFEDLEM